MTNAEINKALALKIGYLPEHVDEYFGQLKVSRPCTDVNFWWYVFDFMDWRTIMPIAVNYRVITGFSGSKPYASILGKSVVQIEDTLQRAIALAVLGAKE